MKIKTKLGVLTDFNSGMLCGLIANSKVNPSFGVFQSDYGQMMQTLMDSNSEFWKNDLDLNFIWSSPNVISREFANAERLKEVDVDAAIKEVDYFCNAVISTRNLSKYTLIATWTIPNFERGYGLLDLQKGLGIRALLNSMNMRLQERLSNIPGLFLLDSARWIDGSNGYSPKLWYLSKTPFTLSVFKNAVVDIEASWNAFTGKSKKVIICDLDDTIWGGIVGDDGWENLQLGGHDPIGESMIDFQHKLKELSNRGILLSIVSKNTEAVAMEAIEKHPEMILRKKNFSSWRINWNDKAQNIVDLMKELNLGLDSAVFLDDNPIERSRVREALPDVLVPEMPVDKLLYPSFLAKLNCFDTSSISAEDRRRTEEYSIERERRESRKESIGEIKSADDWLQTLGVEIIAEKINKNNSQRAVQLLNKTNQFNLSTRRLSEDELFTWLKSNNRDFFVYRVKDKFSDSGITGIASYEISEKVLKVMDFILSCRVMGRRVEEAIYCHILEKAKLKECKSVVFEYLETKKNLPCLNFLKSIKFKNIKNQYIWDVKNNFTMPKSINLCEKNE